MDRIILYHGSEKVIEKPDISKGKDNTDYGRAFYCTRDINAAKEWANRNVTNGYANKYLFDGRDLKVLDLRNMDVLHWIAILMRHRTLEPLFEEDYKEELKFLFENYYIDVSKYDIVIGYRADDSFFVFPRLFVESRIRVAKIKDIYALGFLGEQVALISEKAISRLSYIESIPAEANYQDKYSYRINSADKRFQEIVREERWKDGDRLIDLVKKYDKSRKH